MGEARAGERYVVAGDAVFFRSGWLRRSITIVPLPKIQCVQLVESPFDRRYARRH